MSYREETPQWRITPLNRSGIILGFLWWKFCKWLRWGVSGPPWWGLDPRDLNKGLEMNNGLEMKINEPAPPSISLVVLPPLQSPYGPGLGKSHPLSGNCCWTSCKSTTGHNKDITQCQAYKSERASERERERASERERERENIHLFFLCFFTSFNNIGRLLVIRRETRPHLSYFI